MNELDRKMASGFTAAAIVFLTLVVMAMRLILFFILLFPVSVSFAQRVVDVDKTAYANAGTFYTVAGEPISKARYIRVVEGSPFFNESWLPGSIILAGGKRIDSLQLRLDLVENELHFLDREGTPLVATTPVAEIWLRDSTTNTRYHFINANAISSSPTPSKGWYQLLTNGPVLLLKLFTKEIAEVTRYGTAVNEQTITTKAKYYLLFDKKLAAVKKTADLPGLLKDKKEELENYNKTNQLDSKSEEAFISLVAYYNSTRTN